MHMRYAELSFQADVHWLRRELCILSPGMELDPDRSEFRVNFSCHERSGNIQKHECERYTGDKDGKRTVNGAIKVADAPAEGRLIRRSK